MAAASGGATYLMTARGSYVPKLQTLPSGSSAAYSREPYGLVGELEHDLGAGGDGLVVVAVRIVGHEVEHGATGVELRSPPALADHDQAVAEAQLGVADRAVVVLVDGPGRSSPNARSSQVIAARGSS